MLGVETHCAGLVGLVGFGGFGGFLRDLAGLGELALFVVEFLKIKVLDIPVQVVDRFGIIVHLK